LLTDRVEARNRRNGRFTPYPLVTYYADLGEAVGCGRSGEQLELFTTEDCDRSVESRLVAIGAEDRHPLTVLSPGAKYGASKCWPPGHFAALADRLIEERDATVIVTCGPGEESIGRDILSRMRFRGHLFDHPLLTLGELKSLLLRSDLLVCTDAGPRHIAKAFGRPVVTVFGPTHPEWTATNYSTERIARIHVECGPCQQRACPLGHHRCMKELPVETVVHWAMELLNSAGKGLIHATVGR